MSREKFESIEQFKAQYARKWDPSNDLYLSLEFGYGDVGYRLDTDRMYGTEPDKTTFGEESNFFIYKKRNKYVWYDEDGTLYEYFDCYSSIDDLLDRFEIDGKKLKDIILTDEFEIIEKE